MKQNVTKLNVCKLRDTISETKIRFGLKICVHIFDKLLY